jgi:hypothetical protein
MFKFLATLIVGFALVTPSFATHCDSRVVERIVVNDYGYNDVQALVLVPHQNFVRERVVLGYDYQPAVQVVERIVERERVVDHKPRIVERVVQAPVKVVERVRERVQDRPVRVRQKIVKKNVVVREEIVVERVKSRQRVRGY